jgi:heme-degrading monooxygenase HmoA
VPVTFINPLSVPPARDAEFLQKWDEGAAYVRTCPGFVSTSLHRSLDPDSPYEYFTIAVWESAEHFLATTSSDWWRDFVARFGLGDSPGDFTAAPHLCEQVR